jgi:hypothetical protein
MDHGPVTQDGEIEALAVEGDELRVQLGDFADEGRDQLPLGSLPYMWGSQGINCPVIILAVSDKRTDAYDRMIDMLRKLVANRCPDLLVGPASQAVGYGKAAEVGYSLKVQTMTLVFMSGALHKLPASRRHWSGLLASAYEADRSRAKERE